MRCAKDEQNYLRTSTSETSASSTKTGSVAGVADLVSADAHIVDVNEFSHAGLPHGFNDIRVADFN
jgi:hypothetical protein